jgi:hypothetical protein
LMLSRFFCRRQGKLGLPDQSGKSFVLIKKQKYGL